MTIRAWTAGVVLLGAWRRAKRPRLYGLDTLKRVVVEIDPATGAALRQVLVGSGPTDLDIDPTGTFPYVGQTGTQGLAQLDAESLTVQAVHPHALRRLPRASSSR